MPNFSLLIPPPKVLDASQILWLLVVFHTFLCLEFCGGTFSPSFLVNVVHGFWVLLSGSFRFLDFLELNFLILIFLIF